jgi:hypothetical protein
MYSKPIISTAGISLIRNAFSTATQLNAAADGGVSTFVRTTPLPGGLGYTSWDLPQVGSCAVFTGASFAGTSLALQWLDAGAALGVSGPTGPRALPKIVTPPVITYAGPFDLSGNYVKPGRLTVTGPSGPDVGSFTASIDYAEPILHWNNQDSINTIDRASGVTVTWTGGDPKGYVQIVGFSTAAGNIAAGALFACTARTTDGTFTVPAYVTLAMPPSNPSVPPAVWQTSLWVLGYAAPVQFKATGLDLGVVLLFANEVKAVTYQ